MGKPSPFGVYSSTFGGWFSRGLLSVSSLLECEPTETYIFFPSREKTTSRVQWPPPVRRPPLGRSGTMVCDGPRAFRSPTRYGKRTTEPVFPTYSHCGSGPGG